LLDVEDRSITPAYSTQPILNSNSLHRRCPACDQDKPRRLIEKPGVTLVRCAECSMVYADPIPQEMASGSYYNDVGENYYLSKDKLTGDHADVRFDRELALFREYCRSGKVLDVGCSSGGFLFQLTKRFPGEYEATGTDVSGPALEYAASKGIHVVPGDFLRQDLNNYDAVAFWAVLEHLENPQAFLEKAARILKPDGLCFVLVPNFRSLAVRLLGNRYRYIYPQHVNYFTSETLSHLVEQRFQVIHTSYTHFNPIVIYQDWRRRGQDVSNRERATLLARTNRMKQNTLLAPARAFYRFAENVMGKAGMTDNIALVLRKRGLSTG
jgi:2-polyprenyl-3-methyl-5-hydroxy-6-metoxy-1,4-benzoquinol methylase